MPFKKAIIASAFFHLAIVAFLAAGVRFSWTPKKELLVFETKMVFKAKARDKELLPRKKYKSVEKRVEEAPKVEKAVPVPEPVAKPDLAPKKEAELKAKKVEPPKQDYASELRKLTQSFSEEIKPEKEPLYEEFSDEDANYFDQIYALIKESFIVPPHVNGPAGKNLQADIRLFLFDDGSLLKLDLERSSGDEHFDNAVLDGAKRVSNFGKVPILLQNALSQRGIVVEMCPFKCGSGS